MSNRNDLIIDFIDNLFSVEADLMSHILGCLIDYLIISEFDFKTDDITGQKIEEDVLRNFIKWFSVQDGDTRYGLNINDCKRVINFVFNVNM